MYVTPTSRLSYYILYGIWSRNLFSSPISFLSSVPFPKLVPRSPLFRRVTPSVPKIPILVFSTSGSKRKTISGAKRRGLARKEKEENNAPLHSVAVAHATKKNAFKTACTEESE